LIAAERGDVDHSRRYLLKGILEFRFATTTLALVNQCFKALAQFAALARALSAAATEIISTFSMWARNAPAVSFLCLIPYQPLRLFLSGAG
jgi:hypothetical protein